MGLGSIEPRGLIQQAVDSYRNRDRSNTTRISGYSTTTTESDPLTELRAASASGDLTRVRAFLDSWLSTRSPDGEEISRQWGIAAAAIENQRHEVTSYLLDWGIPANIDLAKLATRLKSTISLQLLLDHGWDINEPLAMMEYPALLQLALEDKDLTLWFLSHGADPNATCGVDLTPLSCAMIIASPEIIEILFQYGGTIEHGQLLHFAARRDRSDRLGVIEYLLKKGADVNAIKFKNDAWSYAYKKMIGLGTPLHDAAEAGLLDVIQLLLEKGVDPLIKNSRGRLAAEVAERFGYPDAAKLIRSSSAKPVSSTL